MQRNLTRGERRTKPRALKDYANTHGRDRNPRYLTQRPHRLDSCVCKRRRAASGGRRAASRRALNSCTVISARVMNVARSANVTMVPTINRARCTGTSTSSFHFRSEQVPILTFLRSSPTTTLFPRTVIFVGGARTRQRRWSWFLVSRSVSSVGKIRANGNGEKDASSILRYVRNVGSEFAEKRIRVVVAPGCRGIPPRRSSFPRIVNYTARRNYHSVREYAPTDDTYARPLCASIGLDDIIASTSAVGFLSAIM